MDNKQELIPEKLTKKNRSVLKPGVVGKKKKKNCRFMHTEDFCHCYVIISVLQVIHGEYLLTRLDWTTDWTGRRIGLDRSEVKSGPHAPRGPLFGLKGRF